MAMMVSHGNEVDIIFPDTINYVERKALNDPLAEFATKRRACLRVSNNPFSCLLDGRQESETESFKPRLIERNRLAHLRPGFRVENRLFHDLLFRNSAKTS
jgi:hypothetical protein